MRWSQVRVLLGPPFHPPSAIRPCQLRDCFLRHCRVFSEAQCERMPKVVLHSRSEVRSSTFVETAAN
jgi:hypothetical protein